jgi:PilZ domain
MARTQWKQRGRDREFPARGFCSLSIGSAAQGVEPAYSSMGERRTAPRYPLILSAEVLDLSSGARLVAQTADLSRTGCYIDTLNPIPPGSKIHVRLQHEAETFETDGRVIYISPGLGMGVAFTSNTPGQIAILDRWLSVAANPK